MSSGTTDNYVWGAEEDLTPPIPTAIQREMDQSLRTARQMAAVFDCLLEQVLGKVVRTEADCADCTHAWKNAGLKVPHDSYCYMFKAFSPGCTKHRKHYGNTST